MSQMEKQLEYAAIRSMRMIVDRSFVSRQPAFVERIHELFGVDAVRSTRTHAKFVIVTNAEWAVVVRTSANLNHNPRLEYLQVVDDRDLADFYLRVVDELFAEEEPGLGNRRNVPELAGVEGVESVPSVRMGVSPSVGVPPRMR